MQPAEVERIARLARIAVDSDRIVHYSRQLGAILDYFARLTALPDAELPAAHATTGRTRSDTPREEPDPGKLVQAAPARASGCFRVPRILDTA